jgi:ribonuclease HI
MIRDSLAAAVTQSTIDGAGRFVALKLGIGNTSTVLASFYGHSAPNACKTAAEAAIQRLHKALNSLANASSPIIVGTDANCVGNAALDRWHWKGGRCPTSDFHDMLLSPASSLPHLRLHDSFRRRHPRLAAFTFRREVAQTPLDAPDPNAGPHHVVSQSRIDTILVNDAAFGAALLSVGIESDSRWSTDHLPVFAKFRADILFDLRADGARGLKTEARLLHNVPPRPRPRRPKKGPTSEDPIHPFDIIDNDRDDAPLLTMPDDDSPQRSADITSRHDRLSDTVRTELFDAFRAEWHPDLPAQSLEAFEASFAPIREAYRNLDLAACLVNADDTASHTAISDEFEARHRINLQFHTYLDANARAITATRDKLVLSGDPNKPNPWWSQRKAGGIPTVAPFWRHLRLARKLTAALNAHTAATAADTSTVVGRNSLLVLYRRADSIAKHFVIPAPPTQAPGVDLLHPDYQNWAVALRAARGSLLAAVDKLKAQATRVSVQKALKTRNMRFNNPQQKGELASVLASILRKSPRPPSRQGANVYDANGTVIGFSTTYDALRAEAEHVFFDWTASPTRRQYPTHAPYDKPYSHLRVDLDKPIYFPPPSDLLDKLKHDPLFSHLYDESTWNLPSDGRFDNLMDPPDDNEWASTWKRLNSKLYTAPGPSGLTYSMIAEAPPEALLLFREMVDSMFTHQVIPELGRLANLVAIPKSADPTSDPTKMRPISMTETLTKFVTTILANRLGSIDAATRGTANPLFRASQSGFRHGRGTTEHLFMAAAAIEHAIANKLPQTVISADFTKAFDTSEYWSLQLHYRRKGLPNSFCKLMADLSYRLETRVETIGGLTAPIPIQRGVRQGEALSPINWLFFIDPLLERLEQELPNARFTPLNFNHLAYADDIYLCTDTPAGMTKLWSICNAFTNLHLCSFNPAKTFYSINPHVKEPASPPVITFPDYQARPPQRCNHIAHDQPMRYLGAWFALDGSWTHQIQLLDTALRTTLTALTASAATAAQAMYAIRSVIIPRILFPLQVCNVSQQQLKKWDVAIRTVAKAKAGIVRSCCTGAVYSAKADIGLDIPSLRRAHDQTLLVMFNDIVRRHDGQCPTALRLLDRDLIRRRQLAPPGLHLNYVPSPLSAPHATLPREPLSWIGRVCSVLHRNKSSWHPETPISTHAPPLLFTLLPDFALVAHHLARRSLFSISDVSNFAGTHLRPWGDFCRTSTGRASLARGNSLPAPWYLLLRQHLTIPGPSRELVESVRPPGLPRNAQGLPSATPFSTMCTELPVAVGSLLAEECGTNPVTVWQLLSPSVAKDASGRDLVYVRWMEPAKAVHGPALDEGTVLVESSSHDPQPFGNDRWYPAEFLFPTDDAINAAPFNQQPLGKPTRRSKPKPLPSPKEALLDWCPARGWLVGTIDATATVIGHGGVQCTFRHNTSLLSRRLTPLDVHLARERFTLHFGGKAAHSSSLTKRLRQLPPPAVANELQPLAAPGDAPLRSLARQPPEFVVHTTLDAEWFRTTRSLYTLMERIRRRVYQPVPEYCPPSGGSQHLRDTHLIPEHWRALAPRFHAEDTVYITTDGSYYGSTGEAGWSLVVSQSVSPESTLDSVADAFTLAGSIHCEEASANLAEVVAFWHAVALYPDNDLVIRTDCEAVIDTFEKLDTMSARAFSRLPARTAWGGITSTVRLRYDKGLTIRVDKVAAHVTAGRPGYCALNHRADLAAKYAALHAPFLALHRPPLRAGRPRHLPPTMLRRAAGVSDNLWLTTPGTFPVHIANESLLMPLPPVQSEHNPFYALVRAQASTVLTTHLLGSGALHEDGTVTDAALATLEKALVLELASKVRHALLTKVRTAGHPPPQQDANLVDQLEVAALLLDAVVVVWANDPVGPSITPVWITNGPADDAPLPDTHTDDGLTLPNYLHLLADSPKPDTDDEGEPLPISNHVVGASLRALAPPLPYSPHERPAPPGEEDLHLLPPVTNEVLALGENDGFFAETGSRPYRVRRIRHGDPAQFVAAATYTAAFDSWGEQPSQGAVWASPLIDEESTRKAMGAAFPNRTLAVKVLGQLLPTLTVHAQRRPDLFAFPAAVTCPLCHNADGTNTHLTDCTATEPAQRRALAVMSNLISSTIGDEEPLRPRDLLPDARCNEILMSMYDEAVTAHSLAATGATMPTPPRRLAADQRRFPNIGSVLLLAPGVTILESRFWDLHHVWLTAAPQRAAAMTSLAPAPFLTALVNALLLFSKQGSDRFDEKTHWAIPLSLLRIFALECLLDTEAYTSIISAFPGFERHHTLDEGANLWGMLGNTETTPSLLLNRSTNANPEYTEAGIAGFFGTVTTIFPPRFGPPVIATDHATQLIAWLPDGQKEGAPDDHWDMVAQIEASGGTVLVTFPAGSFPFLSTRYFRGAADSVFKRTQVSRTCPAEVVVAIWQTPAYVAAHNITPKSYAALRSAVDHWASSHLCAPWPSPRPRPLWHTTLAALQSSAKGNVADLSIAIHRRHSTDYSPSSWLLLPAIALGVAGELHGPAADSPLSHLCPTWDDNIRRTSLRVAPPSPGPTETADVTGNMSFLRLQFHARTGAVLAATAPTLETLFPNGSAGKRGPTAAGVAAKLGALRGLHFRLDTWPLYNRLFHDWLAAQTGDSPWNNLRLFIANPAAHPRPAQALPSTPPPEAVTQTETQRSLSPSVTKPTRRARRRGLNWVHSSMPQSAPPLSKPQTLRHARAQRKAEMAGLTNIASMLSKGSFTHPDTMVTVDPPPLAAPAPDAPGLLFPPVTRPPSGPLRQSSLFDTFLVRGMVDGSPFDPGTDPP